MNLLDFALNTKRKRALKVIRSIGYFKTAEN